MGLLEDLGIWAPILTVAGIFALCALGLQVQAGHGGLLNFGQVGFMAIGAYSMTVLSNGGMNIWLSCLVAILIAVVAAALVSIPTLRLRGDFLAIVAIAAAEIVRRIATNAEFTGGPKGLTTEAYLTDVRRPLIRWLRDQEMDVDRGLPLLVAVWVTVLVVAIALRLLVRTPWGRVLRAVREDEDAARALGKNAFLYKLQAMAIGAGVGAIAGIFYAFNQVQFTPNGFQPIVTFTGFMIIIVAGMGHIWGTVIAALVVQGLLEGTRYVETPLGNDQEAALRYLLVGVGLMLIVFFRPQGIFGKRAEMVLENEVPR